MRSAAKNPLILIADDSAMNRAVLVEMLESEYELIEAKNGEEAVEQLHRHSMELSLVLLDIVMPVLDGFGVLAEMNRHRWIEQLPVIMITSETTPDRIEQAYEMGATDFIGRPFDPLIVHKRVINTILLHAKQKKLIDLVADQIYEKEQSSSLMIDILSHIVEFRNGESGLHVRHVNLLTAMFLRHLSQHTDHYRFSRSEISLISTASALHDIGKIAIDDKILNKPGRLTTEEFEIMKTHSEMGARMLKELPIHQEEPLVRVAYEICRWHHERYDGRGYPDGLVGDQIPISAQIVALADVYDALTSERVYKPAFTHDKAVEMILGGECGTFNPLLMDCLRELSGSIQDELRGDNLVRANEREMRNIAEELLRHKELTSAERTLHLLEHERMKYAFFASLTNEIQFEYTTTPDVLSLSTWGAERLGLEEVELEPFQNEKVIAILGADVWRELFQTLQAATAEEPDFTYDCLVHYPDGDRWARIVARTSWSPEDPPVFTGVIGKAVDIHDSRLKLRKLEQMASHDPLTGLLNHAAAREQIKARMEVAPEGNYALAMLDLDHFKSANDTYGHSFGDKVLCFLAEKIRRTIRTGDIAARVGGDEFLIFLEYQQELASMIQRIYSSLGGEFEGFRLSVSMGVSTSEEAGQDYNALFQMADSALYTVKRGGRGQCRFYDPLSMKDALSAITPIDADTGASKEEK
ncbi:MAG: diguanylate cyclase [Angelakisella sp.]|jgi:diguanylate cyclase (GGDEF)-like protein|nr:diguanylate cyclase [Angelakisella sp.]